MAKGSRLLPSPLAAAGGAQKQEHELFERMLEKFGMAHEIDN